MTRLPRLLRPAATIASLALCAAVVCLWIHSHRAPGATRVFHLHGGRYALRAEPGRLHLTGPPTPPPPAELAAAQARFDGLHNASVMWLLTGGNRLANRPMRLFPTDPNSPLLAIGSRPLTAADRAALVAALDDPDRFAAAHVALANRWTWRYLPGWVRGNDGQPEWNHYGLRVRTIHVNAADLARGGRVPEPNRILDANNWTADPAQRRALRDQWEERLSRPIGSLPYWPAAVAFAVPPLAWTATRLRRARRRRAGLCPGCGYDLRATPDRCPECGHTPTHPDAAAQTVSALTPGPATPPEHSDALP